MYFDILLCLVHVHLLRGAAHALHRVGVIEDVWPWAILHTEVTAHVHGYVVVAPGSLQAGLCLGVIEHVWEMVHGEVTVHVRCYVGMAAVVALAVVVAPGQLQAGLHLEVEEHHSVWAVSICRCRQQYL